MDLCARVSEEFGDREVAISKALCACESEERGMGKSCVARHPQDIFTQECLLYLIKRELGGTYKEGYRGSEGLRAIAGGDESLSRTR